MNAIIVGILTCSFLAVSASAQRGGGHVAAPGGAMRGTLVPPLGRTIPSGPFNPRLGNNGFREHGFNRGPRGFSSRGYRGYSPVAGYGGYMDDYVGAYQPVADQASGAGIIMPQVQAALEPPPLPVRPVTREYCWMDPDPTPSATLSIATRDGTVLAAIAVAVQERSVSLVMPDGTAKNIALDVVDRNLTLRLNSEKHLSVYLPRTD